VPPDTRDLPEDDDAPAPRKAAVPDGGVKAADLAGGLSAPFVRARFDVLAGVLRQRTDDRRKWALIDDAAHSPVGIDPSPELTGIKGRRLAPTAEGDTLRINWKRNTDLRTTQGAAAESGLVYARITAVTVAADRILAGDWGVTLGGRATRAGIDISGSMSKTRHGRIAWIDDGWEVAEDPLQPTGPIDLSWDDATGTLTVHHDWLPGQDLTLMPDTRNGRVGVPMIPLRRQVAGTGTTFAVQFLNPAAGMAPHRGPALPGISFRWTRSYQGPVWFDGTLGFDALPWTVDDLGHITIFGVMRRKP
jgi:hypothetical protein